MVARNSEDRRMEAGKEGLGCSILPRPGAHGKVAAERDKVHRIGVQLGGKRVHHCWVYAAEVQVGDVSNTAH
ncbi:hypothetical protein GCM10011504_54030 [Siccirubricoccus deserti]|nr:hypothetical protein GCM10011504_54030 [Siccirubricoccus deserti]